MLRRVVCGGVCLLTVGFLAVFVFGAEAFWFDGRPEFKEGSDFGYYVWRDGDKWHVRWTTMGRIRRFTGNVVAEGGRLESLKRIDVEEETRVIRGGRPGRVVVGPRGRVYARPGRPPVVVERTEDKIEKDGDRRIWWISRTTGDIDGFDFKVDDVSVLRFVLEVDGRSLPEFVEVGRNNRRVPNNPFVVPLK